MFTVFISYFWWNSSSAICRKTTNFGQVYLQLTGLLFSLSWEGGVDRSAMVKTPDDSTEKHIVPSCSRCVWTQGSEGPRMTSESSGKLLCDQVLRCVLHPSPVLLSSKHLSRSYLQILISTTRRSGYIGLDKSSSAIRVPQLGTAQSCKYTMPLLTEIITPSLN